MEWVGCVVNPPHPHLVSISPTSHTSQSQVKTGQGELINFTIQTPFNIGFPITNYCIVKI